MSSAVARQKVRAFLEECWDIWQGKRTSLGEVYAAFLQHLQGEVCIMWLPEFLQALRKVELEMPSLQLHWCMSPSVGGWEQLSDMQLSDMGVKQDGQ